MPKAFHLKKIANAMLYGLMLAYRGKLQDRKRDELYDLLDDMAFALTKEGVEEKNKRFAHYASLMGELSDFIDIPYNRNKRKKKKGLKR